MIAEKGEGALELSDECNAQLWHRFRGHRRGPLRQPPKPVPGLTNGSIRLQRALLCAMASAAQFSLERPLSISSIRRSTSTAQASSISRSSKRLAINRSANCARSSACKLQRLCFNRLKLTRHANSEWLANSQMIRLRPRLC